MSKSSSELPAEIRACLWSYDPEKLDLKRDRREIVTQVLNYGTWSAVKWLRAVYSDNEIREVLQTATRGRWFKQCLNFWLLQLQVTLPPERYRRALFQLMPTPRKV